jgi:uncharacterized protein YdeI (YjbR/CyaY-like superfamily)
VPDDVEITSRAQWRAWLQAHHSDAPGAWVVTYKKHTGDRHVPYDEVVEEALCFGWIDSSGRKVDEDRWKLLVTPRKPGSNWSQANKERIERLDAAGLLTPAGEAAVASARADGSWEALDAASALEEPADLRQALDGEPDARGHWDAFPPSTRRAILEWIGNAKRAETRAKRVGETAALAARNVRANQWRQPKGGASGRDQGGGAPRRD